MSTTAPRITARVDEKTQALLTEAASIAGLPSMNAFVLSAAIDKAKQIMERERVLHLSSEGTAKLFEALDRPASAPARLAEAARKYRSKDSVKYKRSDERKPTERRSSRATESV